MEYPFLGLGIPWRLLSKLSQFEGILVRLTSISHPFDFRYLLFRPVSNCWGFEVDLCHGNVCFYCPLPYHNLYMSLCTSTQRNGLVKVMSLHFNRKAPDINGRWRFLYFKGNLLITGSIYILIPNNYNHPSFIKSLIAYHLVDHDASFSYLEYFVEINDVNSFIPWIASRSVVGKDHWWQ